MTLNVPSRTEYLHMFFLALGSVRCAPKGKETSGQPPARRDVDNQCYAVS